MSVVVEELEYLVFVFFNFVLDVYFIIVFVGVFVGERVVDAELIRETFGVFLEFVVV